MFHVQGQIEVYTAGCLPTNGQPAAAPCAVFSPAGMGGGVGVCPHAQARSLRRLCDWQPNACLTHILCWVNGGGGVDGDGDLSGGLKGGRMRVHAQGQKDRPTSVQLAVCHMSLHPHLVLSWRGVKVWVGAAHTQGRIDVCSVSGSVYVPHTHATPASTSCAGVGAAAHVFGRIDAFQLAVFPRQRLLAHIVFECSQVFFRSLLAFVSGRARTSTTATCWN